MNNIKKNSILLVSLLFILVFLGSASAEKPSCYLIGHSHLDAVWLWQRAESIVYCRDTFENVLNLMDKYPDFYFSQSSAQYYQWMEDRYPDIFNRIKQRVEEGRWEITGGMWVEPDGNIPCGESFVRQFLYGKRYFLDKFGVEPKIVWLPDSFGFNWSLPQIFRKCGMDSFMNAMATYPFLTEQQRKDFAYNNFWWESPDGSRILTIRTPGPYPQNVDADLMKRQYEFQQLHNPGLDELMYVYGRGDNGGGFYEEMIISGNKLAGECEGFNVKYSKAADYFENLKLKAKDLPVLNDEVFCEYFLGVYTTQAKTKRNNRKSECLMMNAEKLASIASRHGGSYPAEGLEKAWKTVLFNQFHDILPGSSIAAAYVDAEEDYKKVFKSGKKMLSSALEDISSIVDTTGEGISVLVFNSLSWKRKGLVELSLDMPENTSSVRVLDSTGKEVPSQIIRHNTANNLLFTGDVPPLGYAEYKVIYNKGASGKEAEVKTGEYSIENKYFKVEINSGTGWLSSIYDKLNEREVLGGSKGNVLQVFKDAPYDFEAWILDERMANNKYDEPGNKKMEITVLEEGPVRGVIRVKHVYKKSTFIQDIVLTGSIPQVDFRLFIEWHQKNMCAKVAFPVSVSNDYAAYEIPYGYINRKIASAPGANPREKTKWEANAQKWIDYADKQGDYGISLLNDSRYGFDVRDDTLRMTLVRSPYHPDPSFLGLSPLKATVTDQGEHELAYALYPHKGDWKDAGTVRKGYEFNYPLLAHVEPSHSGRLPKAYSLAEVKPANIILSVLKRAEDSDELVLRFYETSGTDTTAEIVFSDALAGAWETDCLEKGISKLKLTAKGRKVLVPVGHNEIKTIRVK